MSVPYDASNFGTEKTTEKQRAKVASPSGELKNAQSSVGFVGTSRTKSRENTSERNQQRNKHQQTSTNNIWWLLPFFWGETKYPKHPNKNSPTLRFQSGESTWDYDAEQITRSPERWAGQRSYQIICRELFFNAERHGRCFFNAERRMSNSS